MKLYDTVISGVGEILANYNAKNLKVDSENAWSVLSRNHIVFEKDMAFELGGSNSDCCEFQCVTSDNSLVAKDEILLYGKDLTDIATDVPFTRIVFLQIDSLEHEEKVYNSIKNLEFIKYKLFLDGYMMRVSALDFREQVRVSKKAIDNQISFERIGNSFINQYRQNSCVKAVKVIFITENLEAYEQFHKYAKKVDDITISLNTVLSGMNFDCKSCNLKPICDEVEGLRELHFNNANKTL